MSNWTPDSHPSPTQVTTNVIKIVDNILRILSEEHLESEFVTAPSTILDALEDQVRLYQTKGEGNNLTVTGQRVVVEALQILESNFADGIGFATMSRDQFKGTIRTEIFTDSSEMHKLDFNTAIVLPPGLPSLFTLHKTREWWITISFKFT